MSAELSVIVPTYQRRDSLRQVLAALAKQDAGPDGFEVVVAVDGATDGTAEMAAAEAWPYRLRVVAGERAGPGAARNRGAAAAQGALLLFLDDDIVASRGLLAAHYDGHRGQETACVCLGQVRTRVEGTLSPWEWYLSRRFEEHYDKLARPGYRPDFWDCLSGNFSLPRWLWQESGGFDASRAMVRHEDIELGYRLQRQGARFVYAPAALGYHRFVKSADAGLRDARAEGRSAQRLAQRYPPLAPALLEARWSRYPPLFRGLLRWGRAHPRGHAWLARAMACWLRAAERGGWPAVTMPPLRTAFHLYFWWGVWHGDRATAGGPGRQGEGIGG